MSGDFDDTYAALLAAMADLVALLSAYGERDWANWVHRDRTSIERGEQHGLDSMLEAFGGVGSLSDLVIHPRNGHAIDQEDVDAVNVDLARLRTAVYAKASAIKRDLGR